MSIFRAEPRTFPRLNYVKMQARVLQFSSPFGLRNSWLPTKQQRQDDTSCSWNLFDISH